jgi:hypothetical protein
MPYASKLAGRRRMDGNGPAEKLFSRSRCWNPSEQPDFTAGRHQALRAIFVVLRMVAQRFFCAAAIRFRASVPQSHFRGSSSITESQPAKLNMRVRSRHAPSTEKADIIHCGKQVSMLVSLFAWSPFLKEYLHARC